MENKKRIEELTQEIYDNTFYTRVTSNIIAKYIIKNNYQKRPKNAVILTNQNLKEEKEKECQNTAKKIFEKLLAYIGTNQMFCSIDGRKITLIDCDYLFNYIAKLARHYRIEVNE